MSASDVLKQEAFGPVTVLYGPNRGKYPNGNTLWVRGPEESALIDPALGLIPRRDALPQADRILNSHCHEDHWAGNFLFPELPVHLHEADVMGMQSLENLLEIYGYNEDIKTAWIHRLLDDYHFVPRPDAHSFRDGDVFDLGGPVRIRVIHAPGHTRGHCFFWIEPDDILYLADVDLSSFGPYYGDAWSDLEDFERTLDALERETPRYWATFHHIGVIEEPGVFRERLKRFRAMIGDREQRLLAFLAEAPRGMAEIVDHRFVYRPGDEILFGESVERRSMELHLARLIRSGQVEESEPGRFRSRDASHPSSA